jgi:hypothetical protein
VSGRAQALSGRGGFVRGICKSKLGFIFSVSDHPTYSHRDSADSAIARLTTPPFSRVAGVGWEILVFFLFSALFLFLNLLYYIRLQLEKHENVFNTNPSCDALGIKASFP